MFSYAYYAALRGPDVELPATKKVFTAPLRALYEPAKDIDTWSVVSIPLAELTVEMVDAMVDELHEYIEYATAKRRAKWIRYMLGVALMHYGYHLHFAYKAMGNETMKNICEELAMIGSYIIGDGRMRASTKLQFIHSSLIEMING